MYSWWTLIHWCHISPIVKNMRQNIATNMRVQVVLWHIGLTSSENIPSDAMASRYWWVALLGTELYLQVFCSKTLKTSIAQQGLSWAFNHYSNWELPTYNWTFFFCYSSFIFHSLTIMCYCKKDFLVAISNSLFLMYLDALIVAKNRGFCCCSFIIHCISCLSLFSLPQRNFKANICSFDDVSIRLV